MLILLHQVKESLEMKAIQWTFEKSKKGITAGTMVFEGNLPVRMQDEFRKYAKQNEKCRPSEKEFDMNFNGKSYHVSAILPKYKGDSKCFIVFNYNFTSEDEYQKIKSEW